MRAALDGNMTASDITSGMVDTAAMDQLGFKLELTRDEVSASLDPRASVAARSATGGPGPEGVRRRSAALLEQAAADDARNAALRGGIDAARRELKQAMQALAATDGAGH